MENVHLARTADRSCVLEVVVKLAVEGRVACKHHKESTLQRCNWYETYRAICPARKRRSAHSVR